jgi:hypothetical protein
MFSLVARQHRIWCDADPDGANGGWDAVKVQNAVTLGWITQAQADEIIATQGHVGVLQSAIVGPVVEA